MTEERRRQCRAAQARYRRTAKGRATEAKWNTTAKRLDAARRYRKSPLGRATLERLNAQRLFSGQHYLGHAETREQATALNALIKEKLLGFKQGFKARAEAESLP